METRSKQLVSRLTLLTLFAFAYFVLYPEDFVLLVSMAARTLGLSQAISPWLYALVSVGIVCWTALRICARSPAKATFRDEG